jgi:hypothetical protein
MNNKTGFWSAFGALVGGAIGATTAKYAVQVRPRHSYTGRPPGTEIEDAMVIGGAAGAMIGAFVGGGASSPKDTSPPKQLWP